MSSPVPDPARAADVRAITGVVKRWTQAFAAAAAQWINAFRGARRCGPPIAAFLQEPCGRGFWATATWSSSPPAVRFRRPDVAVEHEQRLTLGQRTPGGAAYPDRRSHYQRVLTKDGGRWRMPAHLISGEKARLA